MMWNKIGATQKISTFFVMAIISAVFMLGGAHMIDETMSNYPNSTVNTSWQNTYGAVSTLTNSTSSMQGFINGTAGSSNPVSFVLNGFGTVINVVGASVNFFATLIGDFISEIPLPANFGATLANALVAIFIAMVAFMIISAVFRWNVG